MIIGYLWFVNSIMLIIWMCTLGFFFLFPPQKTIYKSIKNNIIVEMKMPEIQKDLNTEAILTRDIFNALPIVPKEQALPHITPQPAIKLIPNVHAPEPIPIEALEVEDEYLLPPLQISVKGTIITSNPRNNRVFLENNRTKEEKMYAIGDIVEDAQIVFIGKAKASLVRSNGQQETIYLTTNAAKNDDSGYLLSWEKIISHHEDEAGESKRRIDLRLLEKKTRSAAELIDMLDLVTYFKNNLPIGCLIGMQGADSLGVFLGLEYGDIITKVDGISTATPASRITLYEHFINQDYDAGAVEMIIEILRNNRPFVLRYELFKSKQKDFRKGISFLGEQKTALVKKRPEHAEKVIIDQVNQNQKITHAIHDEFESNQKQLISQGKKSNAIMRK